MDIEKLAHIILYTPLSIPSSHDVIKAILLNPSGSVHFPSSPQSFCKRVATHVAKTMDVDLPCSSFPQGIAKHKLKGVLALLDFDVSDLPEMGSKLGRFIEQVCSTTEASNLSHLLPRHACRRYVAEWLVRAFLSNQYSETRWAYALLHSVGARYAGIRVPICFYYGDLGKLVVALGSYLHSNDKHSSDEG